jgi:hypothetical protein
MVINSPPSKEESTQNLKLANPSEFKIPGRFAKALKLMAYMGLSETTHSNY